MRDLERLRFAIHGHDTVIHAAALKYVPEAEANPSEAVVVNVEGSRSVIAAAIYNGVDQVVGISTDKACRPVNVYGMTKLIMERLFQEHDRPGGTRFKLVRYGNVVGSTGSVVPIFRRQAREGRLKITDPIMTRFWLSVDEAVDLVFATLAPRDIRDYTGGAVLIPRLAGTNMETVARAVARHELGEAKADKLPWDLTGQRFGEKMHEELLTPVEKVYAAQEGHLMWLQRVTGGVVPGHVEQPYNSNTPDRWLNEEDFIELLEAGGETHG